MSQTTKKTGARPKKNRRRQGEDSRRGTETRQSAGRQTETRQRTESRQTEARQRTESRQTETRQRTEGRQTETRQRTQGRQTETRQRTEGRQTETRQRQEPRGSEKRQPGWSPWNESDFERELAAARSWTPDDGRQTQEDRTDSEPAVSTRTEQRQKMEHTARTERRQRTEHQPKTGNASGGVLQAVTQKTHHIRRRWRRIVRENRTHRFPESDRFLIQMLLLLWGVTPMLASRFHEKVFLRSQKARQKSVERSAKHDGRRGIHPAVFLGSGCVAAGLILFFATYTMGTTVSYDGQVIGSVASESVAENARKNLEQVTAQTLGRTYQIDGSLLHYESGLMRREDLVDAQTYQEDLSQELGMVTQAYCLYVDGEAIGATPYEGALEALLQQMKQAATNEGTISVEFAEAVDVKKEYVATEQLQNLGHLAETLYSTKTAEVTYTVAKGDTWSEIAESHGLTSKELLALNPGYNIDKLQIDEVLTMSASVPYLTMTVVQQERYVESVPYAIEYTDSASLWVGDYEITSSGQYGAADMVANVTYVNGEETERTVLSSVTLQEPVTEQRLRGTKERPTWHATGTFRWPTTGRLSSYFGGRRSPGGIGSTNHKGIDIAVPKGTPIYAADGGTVTYAGWMSGYGYLVQIDHGNGYVTRYGHNSSLTVSVGAHVYKGQQIARAGSTGNSTGNHCHFEVRYNGVARNPLNYL